MKFKNFSMKKACIALIAFLAFSMGTYTKCISAISYAQVKEIKIVSIKKSTKKVWCIKFDKNIDVNSIKSNIYIIDSSNNKITANSKLLSDKKTVEVSAVKEYVVNKSYKIYIKNIKGEKGEKLSKQVIYSFKVEPSNSKIISIKTNINALITYIQINTSKEVFKVTINNVEMKYERNNNYALGLKDIGNGKKVTIKAYDSNNKLLEQKEHIVSR